MRLEYFQLIDRIVDLSLGDRKISTEATVPTTSTIFEGHFPGYPLMPGVLLIEAMAQTAGWLVVAANKFERMAFLAAVKEAKFRTFGCGSAIASSSLATEWVKGKTVNEALEIKNTDIVKELALPPVKIHCSVLAEDAIRAAIGDWKKKNGVTEAAEVTASVAN